MRQTTRVVLALGIAVAFFAASSVSSYGQARNLITEKIVESNAVPLQGSIHPLAQAQYDKGAVADDKPLGHLFLLLNRSPEQQRNLDATVDQLHDPKSPMYHKWLTAEEYGKTFGISDSDLHTVESWLQSKGFTIEETPAGRTAIIFTGTVGQLRRAFNVEIHQFSVNGQPYQANVNIPTIPAALAPAVVGFKQLHNFPHKPNKVDAGVFKKDTKTGQFEKVTGPLSAPEITFNYSGYLNWDVTPQDFYTIYNENPALNAGITGAGVTIAVIEETGIHNNTTNGTGNPDITGFRAAFGLPAYPTTGANSPQGGINYMNGSSGASPACAAASTPTSTNEEGEALLDAEWAGAVAPNAIIDFVACATGSGVGNYGTDISATYIANHLYSTVSSTSLSYGVCETSAGTTGKTFYTDLWEQMAAEGITAVVSSGDAGSAGCNQNASYETSNISSNAMSSTAYNISAGGTDFSDSYQGKGTPSSAYWSSTNTSTFGSALSYIPEITWGGECSNPVFISYLQALGVTNFGTTYTTQAVCNTKAANTYRAVVGGGGGISVYNIIPTWQSVYGIGNARTSPTYRNQPDIAFFASAGWWSHALLYCQSDTGYACTYTNGQDAYYQGAGGTSFVAPQVNGLMALINQKTGSRQGQANYTLYNLAAQEYGATGSPSATISNCSGSALGPGVSSSCIFNDIANDTPCLPGGTTMCGTANGASSASTIASDIVQACHSTISSCYALAGSNYGLSSSSNTANTLAYQSAPGYDLGTGLGSVNIGNLVDNWTVSAAFTSSTTISASSSSITNTTNTTLTGTVTATKRGGVPSGVVNFFIGSTGGTSLGSAALVANACTGTAPTVVCTASATLSVAGSALACGNNSVIAYFPGDAANDAASTSSATGISVICQQPTTTSVASSSNPLTYGQAVSFTASVTGNSPTGTVQFTIDGSNSGSPVTLSSGSATSASTPSLTAGTHTVTAVYSGDSNNAGSSGTLAGGQVVNQASQTIVFSVNAPGSAEYGSIFTVVAAGGASGNPLVFTSAGSCSNVGATYTMTSGTGTCSVIVDQAGNANYGAAVEVTETTVATNANDSVSVGSSLNPSTYGQSVTFTATITSDTGMVKSRKPGKKGVKPLDVTGNVIWDNNTGCGVTPVVSTPGTGTGTATCTTSSLGAGSETVTASYSGDANHNGGSGSVSQTVNQASQTIVFSVNAPGSAEYGSSFTVVAAGGASGNPLVFTSAGACTNIGATYTMTSGTGTCSVIADQAGNANYGAAVEVTETTVATNANGSVSVGSSLNPSTYGQSVTFTATITSDTGMVKSRKPGKKGVKPLDVTGTVTWSANTGCSASTLTGNPGAATCTTTSLGAGSGAITATYSGDANHNGGSGSVSQTVNQASQTIVFSVNAPGSAEYGSSFTVVAAGGASGNPLVFTSAGACTNVGATYTMTSGTGTCSVIADQAGNANYGAAVEVTETTVATNANGSVSVGSSLNPSTYGQSVTFTATITSDTGMVKSRKPGKKGVKPLDVTGTVTWSANTGCSASTLTGNPGAATCTTTSLGAGSGAITATYSGDANHNGGSGSVSQTVNQASQTIVFSVNAPGSAEYGSSFTVVAAGGASGNPLVFTSAGSCSNVGATYTMTNASGTCSVTASQAGNANYSAAAPVVQVTNATKASQTISVATAAPSAVVKNSSFTVVASSSSGLPVSFVTSGACTNSGGTITMANKATGSCTITMTQAGNGNYAAASPVVETTAIAAPRTPTVSFTGAPASAAYGSTFVVTATTDASTTAVITATTPAACTISGNTVTMVSGTGTCVLGAKWAADDVYSAATATQKTTAALAASVITWATPAPIAYGTALSAAQLNATANVPGKFVYTPGSGKVLTAGPQTLSVTFTPSAASDYATVTVTVQLVVNQAATTTAITASSLNPSTVGRAVKFSFTVAPGKPTGSATVNASTGESCTGTLTSGKGTCSITFAASGTRTMTASYAGDTNNQGSVSAGFTQTVN